MFLFNKERRTTIRKELRLSLELDITYSEGVLPVRVTGAEAANWQNNRILSDHSRAQLLAPDATAIDRDIGYSKIHRAFH